MENISRYQRIVYFFENQKSLPRNSLRKYIRQKTVWNEGTSIYSMKIKLTKKRIKGSLFVIVLAFIILLPGLYNELKIVKYEIKSEKIISPVRLAVVADLHSCKYGKNMGKLIDAIKSTKADAILIAGDFFDDKLPENNSEFFLKGIFDRYPLYYVTGNHEYWSKTEKFKKCMAILEKYKVKRLSGDICHLNIRGNEILICGVDDPDGYWQKEKNSFEDQLTSLKEKGPFSNYTILLSHRPEFYELYQNKGFDLVVSGHAHGGQWQIPGLLNGLYAPDQGFFPEYTGGLYEELPAKMIVSRGLSRESTIVPRIYNRPELVIIDLMK